MSAVRKLLLLFFTRVRYYNYTTPGVIKTEPLHITCAPGRRVRGARVVRRRIR